METKKKKALWKRVRDNRIFASMAQKESDLKREHWMNFMSERSHRSVTGCAVLTTVDGQEVSENPRTAHQQHEEEVVRCCVLVLPVERTVELQRRAISSFLWSPL